MALRMQKPVNLLITLIEWSDEEDGNVAQDICVSNINSIIICCKTAYCHDSNDSRMIDDEEIIKESPSSTNGYLAEVNHSVDLIRLDYLLNYPTSNIIGGRRCLDDYYGDFDHGLLNMMCTIFCGLLPVVTLIAFHPFWPIGGTSLLFAARCVPNIGIIFCIFVAAGKFNCSDFMTLMALYVIYIQVNSRIFDAYEYVYQAKFTRKRFSLPALLSLCITSILPRIIHIVFPIAKRMIVDIIQLLFGTV